MTLSPTVTEWAEAYEQEYGHRPDELVLQITEHISKVGGRLREKGRAEASEGCKPLHREEFENLVCKAFNLKPNKDPEFVETIADLWQSYYMGGYNARERGMEHAE